MVLMLDEDESFAMEANVEAAGPQRVALSGYLVQRRSDGTYVAPLIPQLFYGANGQQLQSWRQDLQAGAQTILSRYGGEPSVPKHELAWRKISEPTVGHGVSVQKLAQPFPTWVVVTVGGAILLLIGYGIYRAVR